MKDRMIRIARAANKNQGLWRGTITAMLAAFLVVSVCKYGGWGLFLPAGGAVGASWFWMQREERQYARLRRLKRRVRKLRMEMEAEREVEA